MAAKMATRRANHAATASPATAKRGRLSERAWADILRATRVVREEGVALRVHGIEIFNKRKPLKMKKKVPRQEQKKPTETVAPTLPSTANGETPPPPRSKRKQRSAQRLLDFQEKKRAAAVQKQILQGADPIVAQETVARSERRRLEIIAQLAVARATPMEAESSIEGRPPGEQERQPRDQVARPKRARKSGRPETG